ncbi:hypothetical protein CLOM_g14158 [Closterium sp. NIES-68]|nr:hypothetical protein CLOM_g14158 [Closterium sp. NIES-68]GJP80596.1 hypothetical protein CLOP_g10798 [Closterium sp. NIES-67]
MSAGCGGDGGGVEVLSSPHFTNHLRLPRVRCPRGGLSRGTVGSSPRMGRSRSSPRLASPRTPRRRTGRLSAGAAMAFFNTCRSPTSPTFATFFQLQQQLQQEIQQGIHQQQQQQNALLPATWRPLSPAPVGGGGGGSGGGEGSSGAARSGADAEYSAMVNEELLLFFYRMDLNARLETALQADQDEAAQELREKIAEIDRETLRQRDAKAAISFPSASASASASPSPIACATSSATPAPAAASPSPFAESATEVRGDAVADVSSSYGMPPLVEDGPLSMHALREELQRAADGEKAEGAGGEQRSAGERTAAQEDGGEQGGKYRLQLGQRVQHCRHAYHGVIVGMDPLCCESAEWMAGADVAALSRGPSQPFYQVLLDSTGGGSFPVAYVAEELLALPHEATTEPLLNQFSHPYLYLLFHGTDAQGNFIPCRQLREKYGKSGDRLGDRLGESFQEQVLNGGATLGLSFIEGDLPECDEEGG